MLLFVEQQTKFMVWASYQGGHQRECPAIQYLTPGRIGWHMRFRRTRLHQILMLSTTIDRGLSFVSKG
jgi:hypothetical protein